MANFNSSDTASPLVLDTSVAISLVASRIGADVLKALARPAYMIDVAIGELADAGHRAGEVLVALSDWQRDRLLAEVSLEADALEVFEDLVSGPAADTLDDGEAATLAHARVIGAIAVIDEGKARRISGERHPALILTSTIDLLLHPAVERALGREVITQGVFLALKDARTRVPPEHHQAVAALIGRERAALCSSLPSSVRRRACPLG
jgi:hypothetical protein